MLTVTITAEFFGRVVSASYVIEGDRTLKVKIPRGGMVFGLASRDWGDRLRSSRGTGSERQSISSHGVVWCVGSDACCNCNADAFSRYAFRQRYWHPKVLR